MPTESSGNMRLRRPRASTDPPYLYYSDHVPVSLSVRLPEKVAKDLDQVASATDRPRSYLVLKALESYLSEYADYQIALDRLRDKDDPIISSRELRRRLATKQRL